MDEKSIDQKLKQLQLDDFHAKIDSIHHLIVSDIYLSFTKTNANVNLALKRFLNPTKKQILDRMKEVFYHLSDKEINAELVYKIEQFEESLKQKLPILKQLKALILKNIKNVKNLNQKFTGFIKTVSQFESIFLDFAKDNAPYSKPESNDPAEENYGSKLKIFDELLGQQKCPFYELDAFINSEIADYEAFIEAIKTQKDYLTMRKRVRYRLDQQLELFNSIDFQSVKDDRVEKIQKKLETLEIEFNELDLICNIMIVTMGHYEMKRFEIEKYILYCDSISKFSKMNFSNQNEILAFFQFLKNFAKTDLN